MSIGEFQEIVGTSNNNRLRAGDKQIAYGLTGNDRLQAITDPLLGVRGSSILVGGQGEDTYIAARQGVTILMDYGNSSGENTGIARRISLLKPSSFVLDIDRRHLLAGDIVTGQMVILIDWKNPRNQIETIELENGRFRHTEIAASYRTFANYLGNYSWARLAREGILDFERVGLTPRSINRAIRTVISRANTLSGSTPTTSRNPSISRSSTPNPLAPPDITSLNYEATLSGIAAVF